MPVEDTPSKYPLLHDTREDIPVLNLTGSQAENLKDHQRNSNDNKEKIQVVNRLEVSVNKQSNVQTENPTADQEDDQKDSLDDKSRGSSKGWSCVRDNGFKRVKTCAENHHGKIILFLTISVVILFIVVILRSHLCSEVGVLLQFIRIFFLAFNSKK